MITICNTETFLSDHYILNPIADQRHYTEILRTKHFSQTFYIQKIRKFKNIFKKKLNIFLYTNPYYTIEKLFFYVYIINHLLHES